MVSPIRDEKDIKSILQLLCGTPRDLLLFFMGMNSGIRAYDLLNNKGGDARYLNGHFKIYKAENVIFLFCKPAFFYTGLAG